MDSNRINANFKISLFLGFFAVTFGSDFIASLAAIIHIEAWLANLVIGGTIFTVCFVYLSTHPEKADALLKYQNRFNKTKKQNTSAKTDEPIDQTSTLREADTASSNPPNLMQILSQGLAGLNQAPALVDLVNQNIPGQSPTTVLTRPIADVQGLRQIFTGQATSRRLDRKKKYLQVALNGSLSDAKSVIYELPESEKIIIEAGTPLIKIAGTVAVRTIRNLLPQAYIVADIKTSDLARREVEMFKQAGADGVTVLGVAPIETINEFILACQDNGLDAMIDMMNVTEPLLVLKKLKARPQVVVLHRGVDETESAVGKMIPYYQIKQIKGNYNLMIAVAGGDTSNEIQSAIFNGADIVVVWKDFVAAGGVSSLAQNFLKEIK